MRQFDSFFCIDWSGAQGARQKGIAVAQCDRGEEAPRLIQPSGGWSRLALSTWLKQQAENGGNWIVGVDFSMSLPFADRGGFFPERPGTPAIAPDLWHIIDALCEDEPNLGANTLLHEDSLGHHFRQAGGRVGNLFEGGIGRLRVTEQACRSQGYGAAQSCFNLVGAAQVGKSSLTGMRMLHRLNGALALWPFDALPSEGPVLVEIYTTIAARAAGIGKSRSKLRSLEALSEALANLDSRAPANLERLDDHATDAMLGAAWLRKYASDPALWAPPALTPALRATEGWTFGVR